MMNDRALSLKIYISLKHCMLVTAFPAISLFANRQQSVPQVLPQTASSYSGSVPPQELEGRVEMENKA